MYERFDDVDLTEDYVELLRRGSVRRRLALTQHSAWRQAIRERAGADSLRVRTWSRDERPAIVWAVLPDWSLTPEERASHAERQNWLVRDD
jgi:hypothetical protein